MCVLRRSITLLTIVVRAKSGVLGPCNIKNGGRFCSYDRATGCLQKHTFSSVAGDGDADDDEELNKTLLELRKVRKRIKDMQEEYDSFFTLDFVREYGNRKIEDITSLSSDTDSDSGAAIPYEELEKELGDLFKK